MKIDDIPIWRNLSEHKKIRFLEAVPATLALGTLFGLFIFSFIKPLWVIYFIIVYSFFWLIRVFYFVMYLMVAWYKHKKEVQIDWMKKVKELPNWRRIHHVVIVPTWKEPYEVVRETATSCSQSNYPLDRIVVCFGGEERAGEEVNKKLPPLEEEFKNTFRKFMTMIHVLQSDERPVKSANANYIAKEFKKWVDEEGIPYEDVIVSNFDSDTQVHPQYFARLAYAYLTQPEPTKASYQPMVLYNNNIWESPSFTRVVANATAFWLMTELTRPEQFMTFSSHSMSFKALVEVGYWDNQVVTEDSRIFLQCFIHYEGDYRLVPMYVPVCMDTVATDSFWQTIVNQYKQLRRWGWSVEHQPYLFTEFFRKPSNIPLQIRLRYMWKLVEGQYSWATGAVLILVFGRLPLWVASVQQNNDVLVQNAPFVLENIMLVAMVGVVASAGLNILLLPAKPPEQHWVKYAAMVLQWILLPITIIVFGSAPALDAQIRLMKGEFLGFWNTEKGRKDKKE